MPDSLLITGGPASGKSRAAMDRFHSIPGSRLIVPSSTHAEHAGHRMARSGDTLHRRQVITFAGFLEERASPAPSKFLLHHTIGDALARLRPAHFAAVAEYRGFREALARLFEEMPRAAAEGDLARLLDDVESSLDSRGFLLRPRRLQQAAQNPAPPATHLVFDGFFTYSRAELDLLTSLASQTALTITLPDWPSAAEARREFLAHGFREQRCLELQRRAVTITFAAPTLEREVEEIGRRVLEEARTGRPFREMGVILRSREPYAAALETAFARFGIPARFYFADPLITHPAVALLAAAIRALLGGWDHQDLLAIAQMPLSGLGDSFDFQLREFLPGAGLPLPWAKDPPEFLLRLAALDSWRRDRLTPLEWSHRLKILRTLLPAPLIPEEFSREQLRAWQSTAAALESFDNALDQAAQIGEEAVSLADFWPQAEVALAVETLRPPDRRANVVHVLDVYEARQWELPVVFVCGLVEGTFPQSPREDPILSDAARRRAGLRTAAEAREEEPRLFELAATRASEKTIFSYPRFNEKGDSSAPSTFLAGVRAERGDERVHRRPLRPVMSRAAAPIQDAALLARLAKTHGALAPTSIETFLQCPFLFFAQKTLRPRPRPKSPRERLDVLLQGNIFHRALAELARAPLLGVTIFDDVFEEDRRHAHVPLNYRTEAVRLEMRRNFEAFLDDARVPLARAARIEEKFSFALHPLLTLRGRIDRLDLLARNQVLVIDYKYSAANKIRERTAEDHRENLVQGGLYMLAAERQLGFKPAGMLYCGLRKGVVWGGWHVPIAALEGVGETVDAHTLEEMARAAADKAAQVFEAIASGRIAADPADEKKCAWCDFQDVCRVESLAATKAAAR